MKVLIENQIFSPGYIFAAYGKFGQVLLEGHENYQKRSYRNRYIIQTSRGVLSLSIPLKKGKHQQMPIQDVVISYDENWPKQHGHSLRSAYGNSPYFEHYFPIVLEILESGTETLFEFNKLALEKIAQTLRLPLDITITDSYMEGGISGGINLKNQQMKPVEKNEITPPYQQVWSHRGTFTYYLSILDTLFCCGPYSMSVLKNTYENHTII